MSTSAPAATYDVFISYSRPDIGAARLLREELRKSGLHCFLDEAEIQTGSKWEKSITDGIKGARYFALIHSTTANSSEMVQGELRFAADCKKRRGWIFLDEIQDRHEVFNLRLANIQACVAYTGDRDTKIREFAKSISDTLSPALESPGLIGSLDPSNCPYRGHSPYDGSRPDAFFGRESEIERVTQSIYESVDKTATSEGNANRRLFFVYGPSGTGKSSLIASGVIPRLSALGELPELGGAFHTHEPFRPRDLTKTFEEYAKEAGDRPCVIAIDQFEEVWPEYDKEIPADLKIKVDNISRALKNFRKLAIVLCFREEYLAKMHRQFERVESYWNPQVVRGLSKEAAAECIRGPAAQLGIEYDDKLVTALVNRLAAQNHLGVDRDRQAFVEPVELQIVCERLWKELPKGIETIHSSDLAEVCRKMGLLTGDSDTDDIDKLAEKFVSHVTHGFLESTVEMISKKDAAKACKYDDPERIYFALLQFVGEATKRVPLKIHKEAGGEWVGRLPISIVNELTDQHLLRAVNFRGEKEFELIHDRLVEPIVSKKDKLGLLYAVNSLDSAMTKVKKEREHFQGWFENYEPLIKDLTDFKNFEGLNSEEAEFIFRSALAYGKDKRGELDAWAETVGRQHFSVLAEVLHDAFSPNQQNGRVRINAATLLRDKDIQTRLGPEKLVALLKELERVCRDTTPDAELEELCYTLATCPHPGVASMKCGHLNDVLPENDGFAKMSPRVLLWMRDKVNMDAGGCFVKRWKALPTGRRTWLTLRLFLLRFREAFLRMAFIVVISAIVTGVGAGAMYAFWGSQGASFTEASASSGAEQGIFHGFFGGITWGFTLSLSTLIYWLILRGRRIEKRFSHWLGGVVFSTIAGIVGGFCLVFMVLAVDTPESMLAAGWLLSTKGDRYNDAFGQTEAGWIFVIYGMFLGFGVGWSMLSLYHDKTFRDFVDKLGPLKTGEQFRKWVSTILWRVLRKSGPMAFGMALAGISMFALFHGKNLDCAPYQWGLPSRCDAVHYQGVKLKQLAQESPIAPLEWRAAGTSVIIYFGAYSLTVAYLLALLTIRFGVEIPDDKRFLGTDEIKTEAG